MQQTQEISPVRDEIIFTAMKFVKYLTTLFELRNVNFLPILSPCEIFHCKLVPSRNRAFVLSLFEAWRKRRYQKSFVAKLNTLKPKLQKHKFGLITLWRVIILIWLNISHFMKNTNISLPC